MCGYGKESREGKKLERGDTWLRERRKRERIEIRDRKCGSTEEIRTERNGGRRTR